MGGKERGYGGREGRRESVKEIGRIREGSKLFGWEGKV